MTTITEQLQGADTHTPKGGYARFDCRADTNDAALMHAILGTDEYRLAELPPLEGWALDIGAHIGTVAIALAKDHPNLQVLAVEPVPDNAELTRRNVALNNLQGQVQVVEAAAGKGRGTASCRYAYRKAGEVDPNFVDQNRYIGNIWRLDITAESEEIRVPIITVRQLAKQAGVERFRYAKFDCEGCEWDALETGAGLIDLIVGEFHDNGPQAIIDLLSPTHVVEVLESYGDSTGIFRATAR